MSPPKAPLPPGRIALIVLAPLRHNHRLADLAGGNGVSASTIHRWTWEVIGLLAARAPRLDRSIKPDHRDLAQRRHRPAVMRSLVAYNQ